LQLRKMVGGNSKLSIFSCGHTRVHRKDRRGESDGVAECRVCFWRTWSRPHLDPVFWISFRQFSHTSWVLRRNSNTESPISIPSASQGTSTGEPVTANTLETSDIQLHFPEREMALDNSPKRWQRRYQESSQHGGSGTALSPTR
jgi:hypothetical protein